MDLSLLEKRRRVMSRSMSLGHCVCSPKKSCPCDTFEKHDVCECAGERSEVPLDSVKLTELVQRLGCAAKIGKRELTQALRGLPDVDDPRVVVGRDAGDDAGIIMLSAEEATVLTVDVFTPPVDDPFTFGQIAAANSLSDVYAMGAAPECALSFIGFPSRVLPMAVMREILRGGFEKMQEARIGVIGGHSLDDDELKFGFAVLGRAPRSAIVTNAGARAGDVIVLTKPLGSGIVTFAGQCRRASPETLHEVARSMAALNRLAGSRMLSHGASAATDVTGFGLLTHMHEVARSSRVAIRLDFDSIPLFEGVLELARNGLVPGAMERNREAVPEEALGLDRLAPDQQNVLFSPETSGGLLVWLPEASAPRFLDELREGGVLAAAIIGRVVGSSETGSIEVVSSAVSPSLPRRSLAVPSAPEEQRDSDTSGIGHGRDSCCTEPSNPGERRPAVARVHHAPPRTEKAPDGTELFWNYLRAVTAPGALDGRTKKLIALALSVSNRCDPCIELNRRGALEAGASPEQCAEAVSLGVAFGGASSAMFYQGCRDKLE